MTGFLRWLGGAVALGIFLFMAAGWWLLNADEIEPPALPGERVQASLQLGELRRHWYGYVPASLQPGAPLLLVLHGSLGDGKGIRALTFYSFDVLAEREGLMVLYPDGIKQHWNDCRASAAYAANTQDIDDVAFLRALIAEAVSEYGVDPAQVYVVGMSNGGQMAFRMALEAPDAVAGVAAFVASMPVTDNLDCSPRGEPVPVLIVNGTEDPINPYEGGLVEMLGDNSRGSVLSSLDSAAYWAGLAGDPAPPTPRTWPDRDPDDDTTVSTRQWRPGSATPVSLVTVEGGGHTMPHPVFRLPRFLGPTSHEFDAAELSWQFFREGRVRPPGE